MLPHLPPFIYLNSPDFRISEYFILEWWDLGTNQQLEEVIITVFVDLFIYTRSVLWSWKCKGACKWSYLLENDASSCGSTSLFLHIHLTSIPSSLWMLHWHPRNGSVSCQHRTQCPGSVLHLSIHHLSGGQGSRQTVSIVLAFGPYPFLQKTHLKARNTSSLCFFL